MQLTVAGIVLSRPLCGIQQCLLLFLSPLWKMPLWYQVTHATAIPSGIISLCSAEMPALISAGMMSEKDTLACIGEVGVCNNIPFSKWDVS